MNSLEVNGYVTEPGSCSLPPAWVRKRRGWLPGEDYLCYYEDGALVVGRLRARRSLRRIGGGRTPATSLLGKPLIGYITDWTQGLVREEAITVAVELTEGGYVEPRLVPPKILPAHRAACLYHNPFPGGLEPYTTGVMTLTLVAAPHPALQRRRRRDSVTEETVTNPDGSQTTIVTDPGAGSVTETTRSTGRLCCRQGDQGRWFRLREPGRQPRARMLRPKSGRTVRRY